MNKIHFAFLCAIIFLANSITSHAQIKIGFYGAAALPVGDFGDFYDPGYGGGLQLKRISESKKVGIGLDVSYFGFGYENVNAVSSGFQVTDRYRVIPVKVGLEYYFLTKKVKPFIGIDAGLYFSKYVFDVQSSISGRYSETDAWESFGLAPGGGLSISISERTDLQFAIKYNVMFEKDRYNDTNGKFISIGSGFNFAF